MSKCAKTEGDVSRFLEGISQLNQQLIALREQLEIAKKQSAASEAVCADVERIKKMLSDDSLARAGYLNSTRENTVTYTKSTQRPVKSFSADGISPYQEQRKSRLTTPAVRTPKR